MTPSGSRPRVFGVDYQFLSCGDVFTQGVAHAADDLGVPYDHALWDAPDLQERIIAFKPDLLFVVHGRKFCRRFAHSYAWGGVALQRMQTAIWLLDEPYEVDDTATFSMQFQHIFVNDPATIRRHYGKASYLPVCYDPHVHNTQHQPGYLQDTIASLPKQRVGFIGGGNPTRDRYLSALVNEGLLDYVVGGAWGDPKVVLRCLSPNITPRETAGLYRNTRIVLNVFRQVHHFNREGIEATSLNPRVYEAFACGALVVSEWRPEVDEICPELPTFRDESECVALVRDLLADPVATEAIRVRCAERLASHTYAARLQTVLAVAGQAVAA